jgi:hypothetical protein
MLLMLLGLTVTVSAQESLKVIDSIFFRSDSPQDVPIFRVFGFGSGHTNGIDTDEVQYPALPPAPTLAAAFVDTDLNGKYFDNDPMQNDIRGLPDSVAGSKVKAFYLEYEIHFQRGYGQVMTFGFPVRLSRGIDSIHIEDVEGSGGVFQYTYAGAGNSYLFTLPNNELSFIRMQVYYNLATASVPQHPVIARNTRVFPNPARGQNVTLLSDVPAGSSVIVSDLLGQELLNRTIPDEKGAVTLDCASYPSGTYFVSLLGKNGDLLDRRQLIVLQ